MTSTTTLGVIMNRFKNTDRLLRMTWNKAAGNEAYWVNTSNHHIAVVQKYDQPGWWFWKLKHLASGHEQYSSETYSSQKAARAAVLKELATRLRSSSNP